MRKSLTEITDTVHVPRGCVERIYLRDSSYASVLEANGIVHAGISHLVDGYYIAITNLREHLVIFTLNGSAILENPGGRHRLAGNSVIVTPAGKPVHFWAEPQGWSMVWFYLEPVARWADLPVIGGRPSPVNAGPNIAAALRRLLDEHDQPLRQIELRQRIIDLCSELCVTELELCFHHHSPAWRDDRHVLLDNLWQEVSQNLESDWSIQALAQRLNMSYSTFIRLNKQFYGVSPKSLLQDLRMKRARGLLRRTRYPVKVVAAQVGFHDPYAFSNAYKDYHGHSPTADRTE